MLLAELKEKTEAIFEDLSQTPEPAIHWKDKLAAIREANLPAHESSIIYDMRREQARLMGFEELDMDVAVEMLMGEKHTNTDFYEKGNEKKIERQIYEWAYNHHTNTLLGSNWGGFPVDYYREERKGLWFLPPFALMETWRCRLGKLNYLKRDIPYGVVLRIQEVKKLNLFNCFNVLAPLEAWTRKSSIDPIVFATIWELPQDMKTAGQAAHFFLAQW